MLTDAERWLHNEVLIDQAASTLVVKFHDIVKQLEVRGHKPRVMEVRRSRWRQILLIARGASRTWNSKHLTGRAMDVIDARYKWADTPIEFIADLFILALGAKLTTGVLFGLSLAQKMKLTRLARTPEALTSVNVVYRDLLIFQVKHKRGWDPCHIQVDT